MSIRSRSPHPYVPLLENLERRDCPAMPVITAFTAQVVDATHVQLSGTLTDDDPGSCTVSFSGAATGSTQADASGDFAVQATFDEPGGEVDAQAIDDQAMGSEYAQAFFSIPPPLLTANGTLNSDGSLTIAGQVSAPFPSGLTVSFSGAANDTAVTDNVGNFSLTTNNWTTGTVTVQAYDSWARGSSVVNVTVNTPIALTNPGNQSNTVGDYVDLTLPVTSQSGYGLTWNITGLPDGLTADPNTGEIIGAIRSGDDTNSPYLVTASVQDAASNLVTVTFNWAVAALVDPIPVSNTNDTGNFSLRAAIDAANRAGGNQTIDASHISGIINLQTALPDLTANITIIGPGSGSLTVERDPNAAAAFRVFTTGTGTYSLQGMTISNGNSNFGGGLLNNGTTTLIGCAFYSNNAGLQGGAVFNDSGYLTASGCTFGNNQSGRDGGAIFNGGSYLGLLTGCEVSLNTAARDGGGIYNLTGILAIRNNCQIVENSAGRNGGGIYNRSQLEMNGGELYWNQAAGGWADPNGTGLGGGYYGATGEATFQGVTFTANAASTTGGGFYLQAGELDLNTCTIGGNTSPYGPGGYVVAGADFNRTNCNVTDTIILQA